MITTEGQANVVRNLQWKAQQAEKMFESLVSKMNEELTLEKEQKHTKKEMVPSWL